MAQFESGTVMANGIGFAYIEQGDGHFVHLEKQREFDDLVLEFLEQRSWTWTSRGPRQTLGRH